MPVKASYKDGTSPNHRRILRAIGMGKQPRTAYLKCKAGGMKAQPQMFEVDYPRTKEGFLRSTWDQFQLNYFQRIFVK